MSLTSAYHLFCALPSSFSGRVAALLAVSLAAGSSSMAQEFVLHAEGDAAFWVDQPQTERFTPGGYFAIRPGVAIGSVVSLQWSYAGLVTPATKEFERYGLAHFLMGGIRLRPFATLGPKEDQLGGLWVDFDLGYVRTGDKNRFGLDTGLGYNFQVTPNVALGPAVRYAHIIQPDGMLFEDPNDGQVVMGGLNLTFGSSPRAEEVAEAPPPRPEPPRAAPVAGPIPDCVEKPVPACIDTDSDGVCDDDDRCPDDAGPRETAGCPVDPCTGHPIRVLVQFDYDSTSMPILKLSGPQTMDPVLDAVARAIGQDPSCRVCVIGYASDEGTAEYNQTLSAGRAKAVQSYMQGRGVPTGRLPTIGLGETCQMIPLASRTDNRRVEFRRLDEGEKCPTTCPEARDH
jgi:opacity protein-like surface antigen